MGVDVFFVISGFLITSLMIRGVERHGRVRLADFWARRARRLLPASSLVLLFSALVAFVWLPVTTRRDFGGDIVSASFYVVNLRLALREVDYLAENVGPSPVQHYWSLAVEEQFYVIWPLLITLVIAFTRNRWRPALVIGIALVTGASFVFALHYSVAQPGLAFFVSTTRIWELGVGALLAIGFPTLTRIRATWRLPLGWVGIALIAFSVLTLDSTTVWPGVATLMPVLGTAAAILAGGAGSANRGAGRLLSWAPAVWIGGMSYSLYLWHWPFLIAAQGIWGHLQVRYALLVVLASAVPAWLSYRYVENPIRTAPRLAEPRPALLMGAICTAIATIAGIAVIASFGLVNTTGLATPQQAPGARALNESRFADIDWADVNQVEYMRPSPLTATQDIPAIYDTDCVVPRDADGFKTCEFADLDSDKAVVLVGDSKAVQWFTPLERIADKAGWRLVVIAKNGCQFADVIRLVDNKRNPSCESWSPQAMSAIEEANPDVVVTVTHYGSSLPPGGTSESDYEQEPMVDGLESYWDRVVATGAELMPILDTPAPTAGPIPECVQENLDRLTACVSPKAAGVRRSGAPAQLAAAERVPQARVIDMASVLCPDGKQCPAVIGNVLVYRSGTHISDTYAATTTPMLSASLNTATDGLLGSD